METARETTRTARREITVTADAAADDRAWRRCYAQLEELRHNLLPNRDARVVDDVDDGTIQKVVVLADSSTGWQAPHEASDALATRVRAQEATFDSEQQRVLTTLLGSTFIEHLKDRLDYTERTFSDINKQLAAHPTRHGHAVRLLWEADPTDPDAGAVVTALSQGYQQLGAQRQEMVRSFLARKIDAARADASADGVADWKDQLSSALDYRGWLRISLQYRPGSTSGWAPFDSAKHGAKSGGEKVVLLSQPLFAAAVYDLARQEHLPGVDAMPYLWCGGEWTELNLTATERAGRTWREAWAAVGVRCDGVSSRVLTVNLPLSGPSSAARLCSVSAGEPVWLTLRSLTGDWTVPGGAEVFVCENPTVAEAAADDLGPSCPPLVCTDGIASGAALDLITGLANAGCSIMARADIDTAGFTVVEQVLSVAPNAQLWRFDAHIYAAAHGLPLPGDVPDGADLTVAQLRDAYDDHRAPLHEERILDAILSDLREASQLAWT